MEVAGTNDSVKIWAGEILCMLTENMP